MPRGKADSNSNGTAGKVRKEKEAPAPLNLKERNTSPTLEGAATWPGGPALIQQNVAVLEGVSEAILDEVLTSTALKDMIVRRLSPTVVVVDQGRIDEITKFLTKRGYEPKVIS